MQFSKEVEESLTYKFAQTANEMKEQGREIISLGLGEPDFKTPQYIIDSTIKALNDGFTHYSSTQGLLELRERIADRANKEYGSDYTAAEVIVTPGIKSSIYFSLCAILEQGDEVVILSPYYVSYPAMAKLAEPTAEIKYVNLTKDYKLDPDVLKKAVSKKTKCILLNSPHNPTGMVLTKEDVEMIVSLAVEYDFYIISDEVYEKLIYNGQVHTSFGKYSDIKDRLLICNGYSKSYAMTGWRLGYGIGSKAVIEKMNKLQQHINTNTCTFIQKGACSIYENEPVHIKPYIEELEKRMHYLHKSINNLSYASGEMPKAGFFYFANISKTGLDSNTFCSKLLKKTGIATTPGVAFGTDWDDHVRFSFAVPIITLERSVDLIQNYSFEE